MIKNVQKFLNDGLIKVTTINAEVKRMIQATSKDFYDWAEDQQWQYDKRIYNKNLYENFIEEFDDKKLSKVWFARWIYKYFEYKQKPFDKGRDSIGKFVKLTTPW